MSTKDFSWGKVGRCVKLTTYHPRSAERQEREEPLGPTRPVVGDLYLTQRVDLTQILKFVAKIRLYMNIFINKYIYK